MFYGRWCWHEEDEYCVLCPMVTWTHVQSREDGELGRYIQIIIKNPATIVKELEKLVVNNGVTCMVVRLPSGYPPCNGIEKKIVSMVNNLARTTILSFLPYTFEDEYGSSKYDVEMLKTKSKEMQQHEGGKYML